MKSIFIFLLTFSLILGNTEENKIEIIEQPFLSELGIGEYEENKLIEKKLNSQKEELETIKDRIQEINTALKLSQERFYLLDKIIEDKNILIDELEEKIENFNIKIIEIESSKSNEITKLEEKIYPEIYKMIIMILAIFLVLFLILLSLIIYQNNKYKKSIEEWKEILELKKF